MKGTPTLLKFANKRAASNAWRGIVSARDVLTKGVRGKITNGGNMMFWRDIWLMGMSLLEVATKEIPPVNFYKLVRDYWFAVQGWDWDTLQDLLPHHILDVLAPVLLIDTEENEEGFLWEPTPTGSFTVKSAYSLAVGNGELSQFAWWSRIWKTKVPQRLKALVWVVGHGKLMINRERCRIRFNQPRSPWLEHKT